MLAIEGLAGVALEVDFKEGVSDTTTNKSKQGCIFKHQAYVDQNIFNTKQQLYSQLPL